jgi:hypothetical protein
VSAIASAHEEELAALLRELKKATRRRPG